MSSWLEVIGLLWMGGTIAITTSLLYNREDAADDVFFMLSAVIWPLIFATLTVKALAKLVSR